MYKEALSGFSGIAAQSTSVPLLRFRNPAAQSDAVRALATFGYTAVRDWRALLRCLEGDGPIAVIYSAASPVELIWIFKQLSRRGSMVQIPDRATGEYLSIQVNLQDRQIICVTAETTLPHEFLDCFSIIEWM